MPASTSLPRSAVIAVTLAVVLLSACGSSSSPGTASPGTAAPSPQDGSYPVQISNCGRTLTFDKPPSRAVLPYHSMAEIFVELGLGDRAVGRVGGGATEPPVVPEQADLAATFTRIPIVSDNLYPPTKEKMLSLRPDFFLAWGDFDYGGKAEGTTGLATLDELKAAGVQVYTVVCPDEAGEYTGENLEAVYRTILDLGTIFGVDDRAEQRVAAMQAQIAEVSQKVRGQPKVKVLAYYGGEGPLTVVGGQGHIVTQILQAAGAENVFADQKPYFEASLEAVAAKQADAFLITSAGFTAGTTTLEAPAKAQFLLSAFPNMQASKDRRVILTNGVFWQPGWRNAQTVEDLARQLHPEVFK